MPVGGAGGSPGDARRMAAVPRGAGLHRLAGRFGGTYLGRSLGVHWSFRIEWEPREIACICGRGLGDYVAYRVCRVSDQQQRLEEHGVVEDTAHRSGYASERMRDRSRNQRSKLRFRIDRETGLRARKTTAYFQCRECGRTHERNLHRLGPFVFDSPSERTFVLE